MPAKAEQKSTTTAPAVSSSAASMSSSLPSAPSSSSAQTKTAIEVPSKPAAEEAKGITADAIANGFATLVGALLGALLAYWFQTRFSRKQEHQNALMAAHKTVFSLLQQINTIVLIQKDFVHPNLDDPAKYISIPATAPFNTNKNVLDLNDLSFMLDTKEGRGILFDVYMAQENYIEALTHWNMRSAIHMQQVQPTLARAGVVPGTDITLRVLHAAMGLQLAATIKNSTAQCLVSLRRAFQRLAASKDKFRAYAVKRFKSDNFADADFPETWGLTKPISSEEEDHAASAETGTA